MMQLPRSLWEPAPLADLGGQPPAAADNGAEATTLPGRSSRWGWWALAVVFLLEALYVRWCYIDWVLHFSSRHRRSSPESPSHFRAPTVENRAEVARRATTKHSGRCPFSNSAAGKISASCPFSQRPNRQTLVSSTLDAIASQPAPKSTAHARRAKRLSGCPAEPRPCRRSAELRPGPGGERSGVTAMRLDMNHVYVEFPDYLWVAHAVMLPLILNFVLGFARMHLTNALRAVGLTAAPTDRDVHRGICDMLLETSLAVHVQHVETGIGGTTATFMFTTFPFFVNVLPGWHPDHAKVLEPAGRNTLAVFKIDVSNRRLLEAELGRSQLHAADALLLLGFHSAGFVHVQLHAYANWAIDPAATHKHEYLRKMSVVTAAFNHAGRVAHPRVQSLVFSEGHGREIKAVFTEAMNCSCPAHPQVRALAGHSRLVRFLTLLRPIFFRHYGEAVGAGLFPENHSAEAYFLGTVVHSLDHSLYERAYKPGVTGSGLDVSPQYHALHESLQLVRNCFTGDSHDHVRPGLLRIAFVVPSQGVRCSL